MRWRFAKAVIEDIAEMGDMIYDTLVGCGRELAEVGEEDPGAARNLLASSEPPRGAILGGCDHTDGIAT